jgi:RND family efflux transporter MFP subunit
MKRIMSTVSLLLAGSALLASADDAPRSRVQYTLVRQHEIQKRVQLPGTVEAPKSSQVASEVEGAVAELHAREGQHVNKGAPLVSLKAEHLEYELQAAEAQHREAEARFALAERNLERSKNLFEGEILSRQQLDDARFELEAWRGRIDQLAAEIRRIRLDLERSVVTAPFSGIVAAELTEVGQWVGKGTTVMELISPYQLEVRVEVPERHYGDFKTGTAVNVTFDAVPGYEITGNVASVVPRASAQARTFPLRVRIDDEQGRIGAGMIAKVSLAAGEGRQALLVPKDALVTRGSDRFVYVVESDQAVKMLPVTTGIGVGSWVEVRGPVSTESKVITRGNERIRPGQQVLAELMEYAAP